MDEIKDARISKLDKPEDYSRRKEWINWRLTFKIGMDGTKFHTQRVDEPKVHTHNQNGWNEVPHSKGGWNKVPHSKGGRVEDSHP